MNALTDKQKETLKEAFEYHKGVEWVWFTTGKGSVFLAAGENNANLDVRNYGGKKLKVSRDEFIKPAFVDTDPEKGWKKDDLARWAEAHEVAVDSVATKAELWEAIEMHISKAATEPETK